jgi:hypothetical protein
MAIALWHKGFLLAWRAVCHWRGDQRPQCASQSLVSRRFPGSQDAELAAAHVMLGR